MLPKNLTTLRHEATERVKTVLADTPQRERVRHPGGDRLWAAFEQVVGTRRAVRRFSSRSVSEEDMNDLLDAALLAPTSENLQPYELCWVRDPKQKRRLVRACMSQSAAKTAAELVVCVARWDRCDETRREIAEWLRTQSDTPRQVSFYYDHLARWTYAPGPFGLGGRLRAALLSPVRLAMSLPRGPKSSADVRAWAVKSAALVCENFMLAARAKGLDTCPMEGADPIRVGKVVGLGRRKWRRRWDLVMVIAVGSRSGSVGPRWRRAREKLVREV